MHKNIDKHFGDRQSIRDNCVSDAAFLRESSGKSPEIQRKPNWEEAARRAAESGFGQGQGNFRGGRQSGGGLETGIQPGQAASWTGSQEASQPAGEQTAERPLPSHSELLTIGHEFVRNVFRLKGDTQASKVEGAVLDKGDRAWINKRLKKLAPMSSGAIRCIPKGIWNVATLCMHPQSGIETIKHYAARVPSDFLAMGCAVALQRYDGNMRAVDSRRAQSILTLTIMMWLLARPSKEGGHFGYVIRGIPYGAFCALIARFENFGQAERVTPHVNTVWGTHRAGGRFDRAELGYMAAMRQVGMIVTKQPAWWTVEPGRRGKPRINDAGKVECWAFAEIFLRIPTPGLNTAELGPLPLDEALARPRKAKPEPPPAPANPASLASSATAAASERASGFLAAASKVCGDLATGSTTQVTPDGIRRPTVGRRNPSKPRPVSGPTHNGVSLGDYLAEAGGGAPAFLTRLLKKKRGPPD